MKLDPMKMKQIERLGRLPNAIGVHNPARSLFLVLIVDLVKTSGLYFFESFSSFVAIAVAY
jgi:hypothetical protein